MRDPDDVNAELRLIAVVRAAIRSEGGDPPSEVAERLLDERIQLAHARRTL